MTDADSMFKGEFQFMRGIADLAQLPVTDLTEIAFAGRSNVGKSSLINALTGRKALARTSHTPGRTQELNFFDIAGHFILVDMPGYGYAKVSKTKRAEWDGLIRNYLRGRVNLRCVFLLVDGRHGLKDSDREMMKMLDEAGVNYRILLTKADKLKMSEKEQVVAKTALELKKHPAAFPTPFLTSAHASEGITDIRDIIGDII